MTRFRISTVYPPVLTHAYALIRQSVHSVHWTPESSNVQPFPSDCLFKPGRELSIGPIGHLASTVSMGVKQTPCKR